MSEIVERLIKIATMPVVAPSGVYCNALKDAADHITALEARVKELEAALSPFAAEADRYDPVDGDDEFPAWDSVFKIERFRRARSTLTQRIEDK